MNISCFDWTTLIFHPFLRDLCQPCLQWWHPLYLFLLGWSPVYRWHVCTWSLCSFRLVSCSWLPGSVCPPPALLTCQHSGPDLPDLVWSCLLVPGSNFLICNVRWPGPHSERKEKQGTRSEGSLECWGGKVWPKERVEYICTKWWLWGSTLDLLFLFLACLFHCVTWANNSSLSALVWVEVIVSLLHGNSKYWLHDRGK